MGHRLTPDLDGTNSKNILLSQSLKWHGGASDTFGQQLKVGDIVACFLDVPDQTISELPLL